MDGQGNPAYSEARTSALISYLNQDCSHEALNPQTSNLRLSREDEDAKTQKRKSTSSASVEPAPHQLKISLWIITKISAVRGSSPPIVQAKRSNPVFCVTLWTHALQIRKVWMEAQCMP